MFRLVLYGILSIFLQVWLGHLVGQGQGGTSMLFFTILVEVDPKYTIKFIHRGDK